MDRILQAIITKQNPWLRGESLQAWLADRLPVHWIPRRAAAGLRECWRGTQKAHLLIGPRQAGKSSLIWKHLSDEGAPVLLVDCEERLVREWCRSPTLFLADVERLAPAGTTLFFEEIQHLDEAGLFLKGLVDQGTGGPILVTGSSSYHLLSRTRESLAGRASRARLLTLSGVEVCAHLAERPPLLRQAEVDDQLTRHIAIGGYPAAWLSAHPDLVLAELVEAFVLRDASDLHRIARPDVFRRLLHLVAGQVGSLVNFAEWASVLGVSRDTVASYISILTDAHVLAELRPFSGGRRAEVTSRPKVYFLDVGLRNQLIGDLRLLPERADRGPALESWVLGELARSVVPQATLHFWRSASGAEVDFVVAHGDRLVGVEVKAAALGRPTVPRAARSFVEAYQPDELLMVNTSLTHLGAIGRTQVRWLTPAGLMDHLTDPSTARTR